jgi:hypothetical protein
MNTLELVRSLSDYVLLLTTLESREQKYYVAMGEPLPEFVKSVSLSYRRILLCLNTTSASEQLPSTYLQCKLEIDQERVNLIDVYCENTDQVEAITDYLLHHLPDRFPSNPDTTYSKETLRYLTIADNIGRQAYHCSAGDDYYPGYFSEIRIEEDQIILKQINRWNARSIDHKNDYHMRDLEFYIPLTPLAIKPLYQDEAIGGMRIRFSDSSSKNNKGCGEKIRQKIEEEKLKFETK